MTTRSATPRRSLNAAEAAQSYINAHGGMGGRPLQVQTCNEMNNPQADIQCATSFVNGGQISVVGLGGLWGENGLSVIEKAGIVNQTIAISGPEFSSSLAYPFNGELVTGGNAIAKYAATRGDTSVACVLPRRRLAATRLRPVLRGPRQGSRHQERDDDLDPAVGHRPHAICPADRAGEGSVGVLRCVGA